MNLDKKAACVWIRDISAATVIKKKKKKKLCCIFLLCYFNSVCLFFPPSSTQISFRGSSLPFSYLLSLSFCCGPLCAADLQSQHPPPLPLFVWNCYANVETAASFFIYFPLRLASYRLGWRWREGGVVGGARGGRPIARPLRLQIKSDLSICSICLFFSPHCNS